ncbi:hypothetical protein Agabi119p4_2266 [Agaricus bisporus var. burnettii]|uniref:Uncharacterized protein n=1 Tax=Agaricus bisporus var. burnettii TaxID=192524 RepID=A0A8H7F905_AGABI|nr:hypothetical protein Agabi119p4_2266 [Agaricus bisporus var. burnettii]
MHFRTSSPPPTTYSAISSSLLSSDDIHRGNQKEEFPFQEPNPRVIPRHSFLIRFIIFVLLEFGFIALVFTTLWRPVILHLSFTITEVKGTFTVIAILWHALAIFAVKDILLSIFSAECIEQYRKSQSLSPRELDRVSRLTTGFLDQTKHLASKRATHPFRLGFLSFLLLALLNGLGPSAISVDFVPYEFAQDIQVANLTITPSFDQFGSETLAFYRANIITQLEVVEKSKNYGFNTRRSDVLIPWPSDSVPENTTIKYHSDIIQYNFSCSWKEPSKSQDDKSWVVEGREWYIYYPSPLVKYELLGDPLILPMMISDVGPDKPDNNSLIPFLFAGSSTLGPMEVDLRDIPSVLVPCNTTDNPTFLPDGTDLDCQSLLVSVLACDPEFKILPAIVSATASSLEATILHGDPVVKNIPTKAANVIFSKSLLDATSSRQSYTDGGYVNGISRRIFLSSWDLDGSTDIKIKPASLNQINQNMNDVVASAAKAYLSGYKPNEDSITIPSFAKINTSAVLEIQKMALVGSKPFLIATSVVVGLLVVLLGSIVAITRADQLEGFELATIVKNLQLYRSSSE